ncbi:MAG: hypothetical protein QM767_04595 [Anaeromyxobacter sp.]
MRDTTAGEGSGRRGPRAAVARSTGGRFLIRLEGALPVGWAGRLAAGLAGLRVSVLRGSARRTPGPGWEAELEVERLDPDVELATLDLLELAGREPPPIPRDGRHGPPLLRFAVQPGPAALFVEVEARDEVGFLDRVLRIFATYGLFPIELRLETSERRVRDTFLLTSVGGEQPSAAVVEALRAVLRERCTPAPLPVAAGAPRAM